MSVTDTLVVIVWVPEWFFHPAFAAVMVNRSTLFFRLTVIASVAALVQQTGLAGGYPPAIVSPVPAARGARDVALGPNGIVGGFVRWETGQPAVGAQLILFQQQQAIAAGVTDQQGRFAIHGIPPGMYHATWKLPDGQFGATPCRLWAAGAAPPFADQALVLGSPTTIRGQKPPGKPWCWVANPWVAAALITAAIAIPIALTNDDSAS